MFSLKHVYNGNQEHRMSTNSKGGSKFWISATMLFLIRGFRFLYFLSHCNAWRPILSVSPSMFFLIWGLYIFVYFFAILHMEPDLFVHLLFQLWIICPIFFAILHMKP